MKLVFIISILHCKHKLRQIYIYSIYSIVSTGKRFVLAIWELEIRVCCSCQRQMRVKTEPTAMFFLEEYVYWTNSIFYLLFRHRKKVSPLKTWPYIVTRLCHFALSYIPRSFTLYTCISYGCMADSSAMCTAPWSLILRWPTAEFLSIFEEEKNPGSQNKIRKLRTLYQRVRFKDK